MNTGFHCLVPFDRREAITTAAAARLADVHERTIRLWCEARGIGRRIHGGPWRVSRVALQMLLENDEAALALYVAGDRSSAVVVQYYEHAGLRFLPLEWSKVGICGNVGNRDVAPIA